MKLLILFLVFSLRAFSHPVIYQGGKVISSANMPVYSNNYVMYSWSSRLSLGVEHWRFSKDIKNNELGFLKVNHLLWRKNTPDSQANLYFHSGVGFEDKELGEKNTRGTYQLGLEADWETRTLYASVKHLEFLDLSSSRVRLGFSPKEAPFEDLQTWFMLQGMVIDDFQEKLMITPMLRFFYHNVLWELGSSIRGEWMFNLMVHY